MKKINFLFKKLFCLVLLASVHAQLKVGDGYLVSASV